VSARAGLFLCRLGFAAIAIGTALAAASCTVGDGSGAANGPLFVIGECEYPEGASQGHIGSAMNPAAFSLNPTFFAGEPIDDITPGPKANRLLLRLQRWGTSIDVNDTLYIDLQNSFEIARCVRGRTINGVPDWDTRGGWCDWSAGATPDAGAGDGGALDAATPFDAGGDFIPGPRFTTDAADVPTAGRARLHFTTEGYLRASLTLLFSCHPAEGPVNLVAMGIDGTMEFIDFGPIPQPDTPPDQRDPIDETFKVDFGARLRAIFHIGLGDQRIVTAVKLRDPIPDALIGGALDGFFDFNLERGRAAQPFP